MFSSPAFAQTAGAAAPAGGAAAMLQFLAPMILIFGIFYFLVHRPQATKMKEHRRQLDALRKGDTVITAGGLVGRVTKPDGDEVEIEIAPNVRVRAVKSTLSEVRDASAKPAND